MLHFILSGQFLRSYHVSTLVLQWCTNSTTRDPTPPTLYIPKPTRFHPLDQIVHLIHTVVTKCSYIIPVTQMLSEVKKVLFPMSYYTFVLTHTILRVVT